MQPARSKNAAANGTIRWGHVNRLKAIGVPRRFNARIDTPEFGAFFEHALRSAVVTPSDVRRRDIAALVKNGLAQKDAQALDAQTLLRLLDELNDAEVLVCCTFQWRRSSPTIRDRPSSRKGIGQSFPQAR